MMGLVMGYLEGRFMNGICNPAGALPAPKNSYAILRVNKLTYHLGLIFLVWIEWALSVGATA